MKMCEGLQWKELAPDLSDTCFPLARFFDENLKGHTFQNSVLTEARFDQVNLRKVDFSNATLTRAIFLGCDLRQSNFQSSQLTGAVFVACDLSYADFSDANLEACCYPLHCDGFHGVRHSMKNIKQFMTLFQLLKGVDQDLLQAIAPWFSDEVCLPDD